MSLEELNRLLNRSMRTLGELAIAVRDSPLNKRLDALNQVTVAIEQIADCRLALFAQAPSLEYHYDPNRPASEFMLEVKSKIDEALVYKQRREYRVALELLESAKDLEPPPLTYEILAKEIESVRRLSEH